MLDNETCRELEQTYRIKELYHAIGEDKIRQLSKEFYAGVFGDSEEAPQFHQLFADRVNEPQAVKNQGDWFVEMFGVTSHNSSAGTKEFTATPYTDRHGTGNLVSFMLEKHPAHLMTFTNALRWLHHMHAAVVSVLGEGTKEAVSVQRYGECRLALRESYCSYHSLLMPLCVSAHICLLSSAKSSISWRSSSTAASSGRR